jgi:cytochrome c1
VPTATGAVGPNLTNVSLRPTLGGERIQNTPENMARWIMEPSGMKPGSPMPNQGVNQQEARDITAFLFSHPYNPVR